MKATFGILLAAMLSLVLAACGGPEMPQAWGGKMTDITSNELSASPADATYNDTTLGIVNTTDEPAWIYVNGSREGYVGPEAYTTLELKNVPADATVSAANVYKKRRWSKKVSGKTILILTK